MNKQSITGAVHHVTLTVLAIKRSTEFYVMAVRDPDNIQLELTAPYEP